MKYKFTYTLFLFFIFSCVDKDKSVYSSYNNPRIIYSGYKWWNYDIFNLELSWKQPGEAIDQILGEADALVISGDTNDTVNLNGDWTERATQPVEASEAGYTVYDSDDSSATVAIQNSITTNLS